MVDVTIHNQTVIGSINGIFIGDITNSQFSADRPIAFCKFSLLTRRETSPIVGVHSEVPAESEVSAINPWRLPMLAIGTRVRRSDYALIDKRNYMLDHPHQYRAKVWYETAAAERGTVTDLLPSGYQIGWDGGSISRCLDYMVESVQ